MQVLLIVLLFLVGVLVWILVAPLVIKIDSTRQLYEFRIVSIAHANVLFENDQIVLAFQVFFFQKKLTFDLFKKSKPKLKAEKKQKKKKTYSFQKIRRKAKRLIQSFQLKKLWLNIDTDSYYYNSFLYPVFYFVKANNYQFNINYQGETELVLVVKNRLYRILLALFF